MNNARTMVGIGLLEVELGLGLLLLPVLMFIIGWRLFASCSHCSGDCVCVCVVDSDPIEEVLRD